MIIVRNQTYVNDYFIGNYFTQSFESVKIKSQRIIYNPRRKLDQRRKLHMKFAYDIPDSFWSLFRSMNRELYMEALLKINEEYEYNNYYLSKEVCLQVLEDWNESQRIWLSPEEFESEIDAGQTPPNRILNWLIKTGWLKRIEDFSTLTTNIIIPDYAAVFLT